MTTTEPRFTAIPRNAVAQSAIVTIKEMIVRGALRAGQRLPAERDLAAQFALSRPSLREAIRALIALNILESRHGEGTFVSSLDPELLSEPIDFVLQVNDDALLSLFEARRVLEAGVAALAAERATDLELAELDDFVKEGRRKVSDAEAFIEHDVECQRSLDGEPPPYRPERGDSGARARRPRGDGQGVAGARRRRSRLAHGRAPPARAGDAEDHLNWCYCAV